MKDIFVFMTLVIFSLGIGYHMKIPVLLAQWPSATVLWQQLVREDCHSRQEVDGWYLMSQRLVKGTLNPDPIGLTRFYFMWTTWWEHLFYGKIMKTWLSLPPPMTFQSSLVLLCRLVRQHVSALFYVLTCFGTLTVVFFFWGFQTLVRSLWFSTAYTSAKVKCNLMGQGIYLAWGLSPCWILKVLLQTAELN